MLGTRPAGAAEERGGRARHGWAGGWGRSLPQVSITTSPDLTGEMRDRGWQVNGRSPIGQDRPIPPFHPQKAGI